MDYKKMNQLYANTDGFNNGDTLTEFYTLEGWKGKLHPNNDRVRFGTPTHDSLIEAGLVEVQMIDVPEGAALINSKIILEDGVAVQKGDIKTAEEIAAESSAQTELIETIKQKYISSTRELCLLAGVTPVDKLADSEYESVRAAALDADLKNAIIQIDNIAYYLRELKFLVGDDAWNTI